jgi:hypothetical protein
LYRITDSGIEIYNVASKADYYLIYVAYVMFILKISIFFIFRFFIKADYEQKNDSAPLGVRVPQFQKPCSSVVNILGAWAYLKSVEALLHDYTRLTISSTQRQPHTYCKCSLFSLHIIQIERNMSPCFILQQSEARGGAKGIGSG